MKRSKFISRHPELPNRERGQINIFVLLVLGLFFLGFLGFAVDYSNLWFHRQMAQAAADAGCQAGAMDLLVNATNGSSIGNFPSPIADFECTARASSAPCQYAAMNGYPSATLAADAPGTNVKVSFPATVPGATAPPTALAPNPYLKVAVTDRTGIYFSGLITGRHTVDVGAMATCGLMQTQSAAPIVVLHPSKDNALSTQGNPNTIIKGGPQRSIQVNSSSAIGVNIGGSSKIDLSAAGPNGTGGDLGVTGGPSSAPAGFLPGTTGGWRAQTVPVPDPFELLPPPSPTPSAGSITHNVAWKSQGCPDPSGCEKYSPGLYASGINVKNKTAIFDPGIYYVVGGMFLDSNSTVRPSSSTAVPGGTIFYFSGSGTIGVSSNSGNNLSLDAFDTTRVQCPGGPASTGLPATLTGNVLLAPCSGTYGSAAGQYRGMLFFQDRSATNVNPSWGGGGQFLLVGNMYFHSCAADGSGIPANCRSTSTGGWSDTFTLQGNSGSGTFVMGLIITDSLQLGGTSGVSMSLNPAPIFSILKAGMVQ